MPVYFKKGPMEIPEPSENGGSEDEDKTYLADPEQLQDQLPQPFRMIDKVVNRLLDRAWEIISKREAYRISEQSRKNVPVLEVTSEVQLSKRTNCLACSEDGKYVFMGQSHGLSVISASSLISITAWEEESVEITYIQSTCFGEMAYLLATVDDMGVSRLFAYYADSIYLVKVINDTDDINQRTICSKIELSQGGDYAAVMIECNGVSWLEIYQLPKDSWLRELEVSHTAQIKQAPHISRVGDAKLSPAGIILKIKPPKSLSGTTVKSVFEVLEKTEDGGVIGSGQNHMISHRQWEDQDAVFKSLYRKSASIFKTKKAEERPSQCTVHFLLPGGFSPFFNGTKTLTGVPVTVCLWWSGNHNLFQYLLHKKDTPDREPRPDVVWPNAQQIHCSAISRCTKYIALGLVDNLVTIWDRHLGLPWSVLVSADSGFSSMLFMDHQSCSTEDASRDHHVFYSKTRVVVTCRDGACHLITAGRGADPHAAKLTERPSDHPPTVVLPVHCLKNLLLFMYRNGKITVQDITNSTMVCSFILPSSHHLATPWNPVFVLDPLNQTLLIQGEKKICADEMLARKEAESSLFVFRFRHECSVLGPYRDAVRRSSSLQSSPSLEGTCNAYLQERILSLKGRNKTMTEIWNQLQQHAMIVQQNVQKERRGGAAKQRFHFI